MVYTIICQSVYKNRLLICNYLYEFVLFVDVEHASREITLVFNFTMFYFNRSLMLYYFMLKIKGFVAKCIGTYSVTTDWL